MKRLHMGERPVICSKCKAISGDDWQQCKGVCPLPDSPHYHPEALAQHPEARGVVGWIDRDGDVWRKWQDVPHSKMQSIRPLYTAPVGASPPSGVTWHPIETAPKDNKQPLYLARFDPDTGELIELDWDAYWEAESESWEMPQVYYIWRSANDRVEDPTHWAYQNISEPKPAPVGMDLHDRVEFALRDAGFDYDEASRIASLAQQHAVVDEKGPLAEPHAYVNQRVAKDMEKLRQALATQHQEPTT